ncbi:MAG: hypothetical protein ABJH72_09720 [Reichenbachiella sp.]|uniref:hypothetical protein n=1 Tax=Reichenbachiella sp. TaxID=2184521 RepID=UPI0032676ED6
MKFRSILILISYIVSPILIWYGLKWLNVFSLFWIGFIILVLSLILLVIYIQFLRIRHHSQFEELLFGFSYIWKDASTAWILGILTATIITSFALILLFIESEDTQDIFISNIYDIIAIYSGTVLGSLALKSFVDKIAPIYSVEKALKLITDDLQRANKNGDSTIRISFPALNIGQFRSDAKIVEDGFFSEYKSQLTKLIDKKSADLKVYTYPKDLYKPLYEAYARTFNLDSTTKGGKEIIDLCVGTAEEMVDMIDKDYKENSAWIPLPPAIFPPHVIIIDDILYTIQTWGLPYYKDKQFHPPERKGEDKQKLARLVVYRQKITKLSNLVLKEFDLCEKLASSSS